MGHPQTRPAVTDGHVGAGRLRKACRSSAAKDIWRTGTRRASVDPCRAPSSSPSPSTETREYLGRQLRDDGFDVLGAARRSEALELAESARPDLVLLAELDLCLRLRRGEPGRTWDRNVPVIVLAPSSDPVERVRALDRGADDVIGRPFSYEELLARIRALLRRSTPASSEVIVAGDLVIDRPTRRVLVRDTSVLLSAKEFELVAKLASEPQRVFTKEELLREVWGYRALGSVRDLQYPSRVRLIGYVRVSRVAGREGASCRSPPGTARDASRLRQRPAGHVLVDVLEDFDQPGSKYDRPGFQARLERVEAGEADGIIVYALDRFARSSRTPESPCRRLDEVGGNASSPCATTSNVDASRTLCARHDAPIAELALDQIRENWGVVRARTIESRRPHLTRATARLPAWGGRSPRARSEGGSGRA